jgi:radical SAM superfamily enzyme YgiQ (UPF0313 family)
MPFNNKSDIPVLLIGFQEQDNLGLGYLAATLIYEDYLVKIIDYKQGKERILELVQKYQPLVLGFSIIFQYHIYDFRDMLTFLRENGVNAHITAGGHYPSLRFNQLFEITPHLDSVVLFEGETTFLELTNFIYNDWDWRTIQGIAYREEHRIVVNNLRPLERNIDFFPVPIRPPLKQYALGKRYATILAGRGCYYNCSFCSIQQFYKMPEGPVKRIRDPEMVVEEMRYLFDKMDCSIFMFQDDDFPVNMKKEKDWVKIFCKEIEKQKLKGKIIWKINCRPDEVNMETFSLMNEHGLFLVYLGIEDGTDEGLRIMNKHVGRQGNIRAVENLKKLNIHFDFGYMLFHPWTTLNTIKENLVFLNHIIGDGYSPVTFCKMLPYAETAIEKKLFEDGRLKGIPGFEDYDFLDENVTRIFNFSAFLFSDWIDSHDGVLNLTRWARYTQLVAEKLYPDMGRQKINHDNLNRITACSNAYFLEIMNYLVTNILNINDDDILQIKSELDIKRIKYQDVLKDLIQRVEHDSLTASMT